MPDDLDDKIRAAMKVLDEETPSGYFEAVPNQILARLEDGSMQHGSGTTDFRNKSDALMGAPVVPDDADTNPTPKVEGSDVRPLPTKAAADRDEDSGLHDIRNLAQSTKQRLSARRITQNPPNSDDVLASSSGSFANIALPQPAKMVSLPELEDLPSKQEILAAQKAAAKARKNKPTSEPALESKDVLAPKATANAALAALTAVPVAETAAPAEPAVPVRQAFTLPSMERKKSKGPVIAIRGLGAAAAAGAFLFLGNKDKKETASAAVAASSEQQDSKSAEAAAPTTTPEPAVAAAPAEEPPAPPAEEALDQAAAGAPGAADESEPADDGDDKDETKKTKRSRGRNKVDKKVEDKKVEEKVEEVKVEAKPDTKTVKTPEGDKPPKKEGEGEPSFDALLKEAGVEEKKEAKPKLEKKSLNGDDFKKGMAAVDGRAHGCYKGTQGIASVKLTVAPSGKVSKVSVGGAFAGKPEASCVESAVKAATFPPWDGGPQSFNYSYMLSD